MSEDPKKTIINRETAVSLSLVITIIGGVWFWATLNSDVFNNKTRLTKVEQKLEVVATKNDLKELQSNLEKIFSK